MHDLQLTLSDAKKSHSFAREFYKCDRKIEWTQAILHQRMNLNSLRSSTNGEQIFSQNRAKTAVFGGKTVSWRNLKVQLHTNLEELEI